MEKGRGWWLLLAGWLLGACRPAPLPPPTSLLAPTSPAVQPTPTAVLPIPTSTAINTVEATTSPSTPTATPEPDSGWQTLRPGLERRTLRLPLSPDRPDTMLYLLRLEPDRYRFEIGYRPGEPQSLAQWQAETGALLVVNGGFFTEAFVATGLIVIEGQASGASYEGFGGMLTITEDGPELRSLAERPYASNEPLMFALQSFPLLVKPGGELGFPEEDGQSARRTVVAQDGDGRLLFIVTSAVTLHQLSRFLVTSDLGLDVALNLDGGPSSGLLLAGPEAGTAALLPVPAVILVYPTSDNQ